ncbi:MAG TPA: hypothetical protein VM864_16855 [Pyrinomonadaceae bacterium]|jgi:hypothetical protein|nr:hypothetical protein [Pyrinomonadaceae bacterium]
MEKIAALTEHYQKTYELTFEMWKQRNRVFLVLVGTIAVAALLTFRVSDAKPLLVKWVAKYLGLSESELQMSFPYGLLQTSLMVIIFYLMMNLFHRAHNVLFYYGYLGRLETEIRRHLHLSEASYFFTREGGSYWDDRKKSKFRGLGLDAVKYIYMALLFVLLAAFIAKKLYDDFHTGTVGLGLVESVVAFLTLFYFVQYAHSSYRGDSDAAVVPKSAPPDNEINAEFTGTLDEYVNKHTGDLTSSLQRNNFKNVRIASRETVTNALSPEGRKVIIEYESGERREERTFYYFEDSKGEKIAIPS